MKRLSKLLVFVVAFIMAFSTLFACKPQQPDGPGQEPATPSLKIDKTLASMDLYETLQLTATKENLTGEVVWSSSDNTKATVENGLVTSLAEGTVTITAAVGETTATCQVTIVSSGQLPALSLSRGDETIKVGQEITVTPTLKYKGATVDATFTYRSQNPDVVTVDNGKIKAVAIGTSDVTVTANYRGYTTARKIKITVTADVVFSLSETEVILGTSANAGYVTSATVTGTVIKDGQNVTDPTITWGTQNAEVATVNGGVITAVGVGETIIEATYSADGDDFTIYLPVKVEKPVLEATFEVAPIDLNANEDATITLDLSSALEGTGYVTTDIVKIVDTSDNDTEIPFTVDGNVIAIEKSKIAAGEKSLNLEFDVLAYSIEMLVATKVITTAAELDNLQAYSLTDKNTKVVWDRSQVADPGAVPAAITKVYQYHGYFMLGADIQYNKAAPAWCGRANNGGVDGVIPGGTFSPNEGSECGFHGTIDGNGHAIIGLQSPGANEGLVGTLGTNGVIKNIAFLNAKAASNSAVVASLCYGRIENVFVQGEIATTNAAWGAHGIVATKGDANAKYINVIADVTNAATAANTALFTGFTSGSTYRDCYAIGTGAVHANTATPGLGEVQRFDNYGDLAQSEINLEAWDEKYWDTTSGVPVFKAYLSYVNTNAAQFVGVSDSYVVEKGVESTIEIGCDPAKYSVISLANEVEGITLNKGELTVSADFAETANVTLKVYSIFAKEEVTEKTITIVPMVITRLNDKIYAEYDMTSSEDYTLTLAELEGKSVTSVTLGNANVDFTQEGTTLTFDAASYQAAKKHGEVEIMISGADFSYLVKVLNVTKVITTADDLLRMIELAPNKTEVTWSKWTDETTEYNYDGYYVLGDNIDLGTTKIKVTNHTGGGPARVWDNADFGAGFAGTFDGRGYTINGGVYGQGGLFGYLWKTGTIKNVAFTNASISADAYSALIGISVWGTMENVLIIVTDQKLPASEFSLVAMSAGSTFTSKNVIVYEDTTMNEANAGKLSAYINHHSDGPGTYLDTYVFTDATVGQNKGGGVHNFSGLIEATPIDATLADVKIKVEEWDDTIWDMNGERAIFDSMKNIVLSALESVSEVELTVGKEYTFPAYGGYTFNVTTESEYATTEGTTIKISDSITETTTFTATLVWNANSSVKKDITIKVLVTNKHDFTNEPISIELSDGVATQTITVTGLSEEIKSVTINDVAVAYTIEGEVITLDKANLAGGVYTFIVLTESHEYIYKLDIVNKIITTKDEFLNWVEQGAYAVDGGDTGYTGAIKLGANIDLEGKSITPKMGRWGSGWVNGWAGTFDGCGYTISNYRIDGQDKGLFRVIHANGVFKNATVKNVTIAGSSGAIACANYGTIENVTVIGSLVGGNGNPNVGDGLFASNSNQPAAAKYINCVGILTEYGLTTNYTVAGIITAAKYSSDKMDAGAQFTNVIAINAQGGDVVVPFASKYGGRSGTNASDTTQPAKDPLSNYQGANLYANDTDLAKTFANAAEYAEWAKTADASWATAIANVAKYAEDIDFKVTGAPAGGLGKGGSVTLSAPFAIWSLADGAPEGVEISAGGTLTVADTVEPCTVTVIATFAFDANVKVEVPIAITAAETDNTLITGATALNKIATEETQTVELSQAFEGEVTAVEYNGEDVTALIGLDGTTVTIPTALLAQIGSGTKTFSVTTTTKKYDNVQIKVVIGISTAEQLLNLFDYADVKTPHVWDFQSWFGKDKPNTVEGYTYTGEYVLLNNIDLTGKTVSSKAIVSNCDNGEARTWNETEAHVGFAGTFDGQGYTIYGGIYGTGGLFGAISKTGIVKNVAIVDAVIPMTPTQRSQILGHSMRGTIENCLFVVKDMQLRGSEWASLAMNAGSTTVIKNVILYDYTNLTTATCGTVSSFINHSSGGEPQTVENLYVFTNYNVTKNGTAIANLEACKKALDTTLTAAGVDATVFGDYWDMTGDKASFKSMKQFAVTYIEGLDNTTIVPGYSFTVGSILGSGYTLTTESDKVTIDGATITALEVAERTEAEITATWNGDGTTAATFTVVIPAIKQENLGQIAEYDLGNANTVFSVEIAGLEGREIASLTVNGTAFDSYTFEGKTLTFDATAFRAAAGHGVVAIFADGGDYKAEFTVLNITKIIRTADELLNIETYAPNCEEVTYNVWEGDTTSYKYDGYFVLGNSIDLGTKEVAFPYEGRSRVWVEDPALGSSGYDYTEAGFHGTFDGRGYTINGGVYGVGGLFGNIWKTGVIKNVALENVSLTNEYRSAVIGVSYHGTMDNVYVHVTANAHAANTTEYALLATNSGSTAKMNNVILYDESAKAVYEEGALDTKFSSFINHTSGMPVAGNFTNVYVFTHNNVGYIATNSAGTVTNHEEKYLAAGVKKFALATTLAEAEVDVTAFGAYWDMTGDRAKFVSTANIAIDALKAYDGTRIVAGESLTVAPVLGAEYVLSTESDAVTIDGTTITANTVETETIVTINATWGDLSGSFTVVVPALIKLELGKVAEWNMSTDTDYSVTIPELEGKNVTKVTVNGTQVTNIAIADNTITFNWTEYEAALTSHGETTVVVEANPYILEFQVLNITKVITTKAELLAIRDYAYSKKSVTWTQWAGETTAELWDGYFVLGNHIDLGNSVVTNITSFAGTPSRNWGGGSKKEVGFAGTFDGRGYTIVNGIYGSGGLFGYVYDTGVIKNVALLNVNVNSDARACVLAVSFWGALENVLMDVKSYTRVGGEESVLGMNTGDNVSFKNVVLYDETVYTGMNAGQSSFFNHATSGGLMGTIDNVFVFTNHTAGNGNGKTHAEDWANAGVVTKKPNATLAEAGVDATKFDSTIWNMTGDKAAFVKVYVAPEKTEINIDETFNVDVKNATFTADLSAVKEALGDTFTVEVSGKEVTEYTYENGALTINTALFTGAGVWGNVKVVLESATTKVNATLLVYRSINNADEFISMANYTTLEGTAATAGSKRHGYFVLTADIDLKGANAGFGSWYTGGWGETFTGTLDGQGHVVYNYTESDNNGGLFSNATATAVVKNISFYNAEIKANGGLISTGFSGTIENVFVAGKITGGGAAYAVTSLLVTKAFDATLPTFRNVAVVVTDNTLNADTQYAAMIAGDVSNITIENAITIQLAGAKTPNYSIGRVLLKDGVDHEGDTVKVYRNAEGLDGMQAYMMTVVDSVPAWATVPAELISKWVATQTKPTADSNIVAPGSTIEVTAAQMGWLYDLQLETAVEGIEGTVNVDTETYLPLSYTVTVANTVPAGTKFTIKTFAYDNTVSATEFMVVVNETATLDAIGDVEINGGDATFAIALGDYAEKDVTAVKFNGNALPSGSWAVEEGNVVITKESIKTLYGEGTITIEFETYEEGALVEKITLSTDVTLITKIIYTLDDLNRMEEYAASREAITWELWGSTFTEDSWTGYYVLGANLELGGASIAEKVNGNASRVWDAGKAGFHGTFDGRGRYINGGVYGVGGIFGHVNSDAVVKNFAIMNATLGSHPWANTIAVSFWGRLENVLVTITGDNRADGEGGALIVNGGKATFTANNVIVYDKGGRTTESAGSLSSYANHQTYGNNTNVYVFTNYYSAQSKYEADCPVDPIALGTTLADAGVNTEAFGAIWDMTGEEAAFVSFKSVNKITVEGNYDIELNNASKTTTDITVEGVENLGTLVNASLSGNALDGVTVNGNVITVDATKISTQVWGNKALVVTTANEGVEYIVSVNATVVTKMIRSAADLDEMRTLTRSIGQHNSKWEGYFALANNISYNKEFACVVNGYSEIDGLEYLAGDSQRDARYHGFHGVLDGRGYAIDGLTTQYWAGGMFLIVGGTIKDIAFTNVTMPGNTALFGFGMAGTIQNVYVQIKEIKENTAAAQTILGNDAWGTTRAIDCFVDMPECSSDSNQYGLGRIHTNYGTLQGTYVVGTTNAIGVISTGSGTPDVYNGYATRADMIAATDWQAEFATWDKNFWATDADGLPVAKILTATPVITNTETMVAAGNLYVNATGFGLTYAVEGTGVTLNGNVVTVAPEAAGTTFTVTVTNTFTGESVSKEFGVVATEEKTISEAYYIDLSVGDTGVTIDLTDKVAGTFANATIAGKAISATADGAVVTIGADVFAFGNSTVVLRFDEKDGDALSKVNVVYVTVKKGDLVITNVASFNKMLAVFTAKPTATVFVKNSFKYNGKYENTFAPFNGWFYGDGNTIDGITVDTAIFNMTGAWEGENNAYVSDIAFTNVTVTTADRAFLSHTGIGRFTNVYVSMTADCAENTHAISLWSAGAKKLNNVFVEVANATSYAISEYHLNYGMLEGVYVVGTSSIWSSQTANVGGTPDVGAAYATREDMIAAEDWKAEFATWDTNVWTTDEDGLPKFIAREFVVEEEVEVKYDSNVVLNFDNATQLANLYVYGSKAGTTSVEWLDSYEGATGVAKISHTDAWPWFAFNPVHEMSKYAKYDRITFRIFVPNDANAIQYMKLGNGTGSDQFPIGDGSTVVKGEWHDYVIDATYFVNNWNFTDQQKNRLWFKAGADASALYVDSIMMSSSTDIDTVVLSDYATLDATTAANYKGFAAGATYVDAAAVEADNTLPAIPTGEDGYAKITATTNKWGVIEFRVSPTATYAEFAAADYIEFKYYAPGEGNRKIYVHNEPVTTATAGEWNTVRVPMTHFNASGSYKEESLQAWYDSLVNNEIALVNLWDLGNEVEATVYIAEIKLVSGPRNTTLGDKYTELKAENFKVNDGTVTATTFDEKEVIKLTGGTWANVFITPGKTVGELQAYDKIVITMYIEGENKLEFYSQDTIYTTDNRVHAYGPTDGTFYEYAPGEWFTLEIPVAHATQLFGRWQNSADATFIDRGDAFTAIYISDITCVKNAVVEG